MTRRSFIFAGAALVGMTVLALLWRSRKLTKSEAATSATPEEAAGAVSADSLVARINEAGSKVRELKAANAGKAAVLEAVAELHARKAAFKALKGVEYVAPGQQGDSKDKARGEAKDKKATAPGLNPAEVQALQATHAAGGEASVRSQRRQRKQAKKNDLREQKSRTPKGTDGSETSSGGSGGSGGGPAKATDGGGGGEACKITLLAAAPILGQEKYLGGVTGRDGVIYGIPGNARRVLRIDPATDTVSFIGAEYRGHFKWLRGVLGPDGCIYGLPCHHDQVLKVNPATQEVTTFGGPWPGKWKWHGGVVGGDGCIYCVPQMATQVLKINCATQECTLIGGPYEGKNKWYGSLLSPLDGNIYCICQNASAVLKINVSTQACSLLGSFPEGGFKWHGGNVGADGNVYGVPCHADSILKVDVAAQTVTTVGQGQLVPGKKRPDGKYKFLGGVNGPDGCIYFMPADADFVHRFDPATGIVTRIGSSLEGEQKNHTKWQNGFLGRDGNIYGIPHCGRSVVKVTVATQEVATLPLPPGCTSLGKWEGGALGADGSLYCMPMGHKQVLKISPPPPASGSASSNASPGDEGKGWGGGRGHD